MNVISKIYEKGSHIVRSSQAPTQKPEENQAGSIVQWPGEMLTSVQHALSTEMFPYSVSDDYKSLNREGVTPQQLKKILSKPNLAHWSGFTRHQCF